MNYFGGYSDALALDEVDASSGPKAPDPGGDRLPFDQVEHRRFEVLAYRLKVAEAASPDVRVSLMQGVGERGRDVVVYKAGVVSEIVQCKNLKDRLSARQLRREVLKLAVHAACDRSILGSGSVRYEIWCPGGFSEDAAMFVDTWPAQWTETSLRVDADHVLESYGAFSEISWDDVRDFVLHEFLKIVVPYRADAIDLTPRVKARVALYKAFFEGNVVMASADVEDALRRVMAEQARYLNDVDARHVLDRIGSFPPEERLVFLSTLVMGVRPELISRFRRGEYEEFAKPLLQVTIGIIGAVINAAGRLRGEVVREFRVRVGPTNKSLPYVLNKVLTISTIARTNNLTMGGRLQPGLQKYDAATLDERFEAHIVETWDEYQRCIKGYDRTKHPAGSDEELRHRIARVALEGFDSRKAFEADLTGAFRLHRKEVEATYRSWMEMIPRQLLVVADTASIADNEYLAKRMIATITRLEELRGSPIMPE